MKKFAHKTPLVAFHLWEAEKEYHSITNVEDMVEFFHKMLTRYEGRPLVVKWLYNMISFSISQDVNSVIPAKL